MATTTAGPTETSTDGNVTVRRHHRDGNGPPSFTVGAFAGLLRRRYDVVQALMPSLAIAARVSGHRTVFSTLGHPGDVSTLAQHARFAAAVRAAHVTTAPSRSSAERVSWFAPRPGRVLSPGVRLDLFTPRLDARLGAPTILYVSDAAEERKGLAHAVAALGLLLERRPDARLLIAGPNGDRWAAARLEQFDERVRAAVDVLAPAAPDRMAERYRGATVTVLPSWSEAFGLVLVESLACGTPVVCTAEGGMPEIVDDERVGRVAGRAGDVTALASSLDEVIDLAGDAATPGRCAAHARRWGWDEVVGPAHEELYRSLLRQR